MNAVHIIPGDVLSGLRTIPDDSVHCCVTSPPYWGLRDYGCDGQIGLEATPAEFIARLVAVFDEVRRVLRDDGTCWVNMGDSYAGSWGAQSRGDFTPGTLEGASAKDVCLSARQIMAHPKETGTGSLKNTPGMKAKDLMGMPWRLAFALQEAGWWLRSEIIWHKPNPMPESVTDRPTKSHEQIFLLTKSARYFYDAEAIKEGAERGHAGSRFDTGKTAEHQLNRAGEGERIDTGTRNARTVWTIPTQPYPGAHFATFPEAIPERCIRAGTSEKGCCPACGAPWERTVERTAMVLERSDRTHERGRTRSSGTMVVPPSSQTTGWRPSCECDGVDRRLVTVPCTVLDPFLGSGTTIAVARKLGRRGIGCELNPEYIELARERIGKAERPNTYRSDKVADSPLFEAQAAIPDVEGAHPCPMNPRR